LHDDGGHVEVVRRRRTDLPVWLSLVVGALDALLLRSVDGVRRRAKPSQKREDGERDDTQDRDLAERVEAAEVDENYVDHVTATTLAVRLFDKEAGDGVGRRA